MSEPDPARTQRRDFLKSAGAAAAALPVGVAQAATAAPAAAGAEGGGYQSLSLDEAAITEALVDHMWPKDALTASGTELGIATFIDRQLAGAYGRGDRLYLQGPFRQGKPQHGYQLPLTPEAWFKAGLAALASACSARFGRAFDKITAAEREALLQDVAAGKVVIDRFSLGNWFNALLYPLFVQGAYADPIYGGNRDKAAWKMIGYPGLPAVYAQDVVRFRGKPHPRSATPQSIQDLG